MVTKLISSPHSEACPSFQNRRMPARTVKAATIHQAADNWNLLCFAAGKDSDRCAERAMDFEVVRATIQLVCQFWASNLTASIVLFLSSLAFSTVTRYVRALREESLQFIDADDAVTLAFAPMSV